MLKILTLEPMASISRPLMENPIRPPIDELNPHKLCISAANEGWFMLFWATHASMVTSAIATPALPAVSNSKPSTVHIPFCNHIISIEIAPKRPAFRDIKVFRFFFFFSLFERMMTDETIITVRGSKRR